MLDHHEEDRQVANSGRPEGSLLEETQAKTPFSIRQLIYGFALGVLVGTICLVIDVFIGLSLSSTHVMFLNAVITVGLLVFAGWATMQSRAQTAFIRGFLIALALAAIIATACGVAMGVGPLRFG